MSRVQQFDFSVDLLRAILWQYDRAGALQLLLRQKAEWYETEHSEFWRSWYDDVFNLQTANEFGLGVWGVILGIPLSIGQPGTGDRPVWGFGVHNRPFNRGGFGRGSDGVAGLTLEQKRLVLRLRYYQIVSDGSIPFANYTLREVFGYGYALDGLNMTMTYVFPAELSSAVRLVLEEFDLLPRPAGVKVNILVAPGKEWGFGPFVQNFNNGPFGV